MHGLGLTSIPHFITLKGQRITLIEHRFRVVRDEPVTAPFVSPADGNLSTVRLVSKFVTSPRCMKKFRNLDACTIVI
jgi:hypothetical protein